ncbi:hypothetical protein BDW75DRAFT_234596 [Aspergillus navahoensis]
MDIRPPERILTVRRRGDQYVGLTVASLLAGLSDAERKKILLYLLIENTEPVDHSIYSEKWVEILPDNLLIYSMDDPNFEQWDGAGYVAMIEDDTLAIKGWFPAVLQALGTVQQHSVGHEWIYLRLFYTESLFGWNTEERPRHVALSFLVWALLTSVVLLYRRQFNTGPRFLPIRVHELNRHGCCSQGHVFPRQIIPRFLAQTDLAIDWLVDMMSRWVIVPSLLQYIGATTETIWNFEFENHPYWYWN